MTIVACWRSFVERRTPVHVDTDQTATEAISRRCDWSLVSGQRSGDWLARYTNDI